MNQTCTQLRQALDRGNDCRFALVDALEEAGEFELADLYAVPRLGYDPMAPLLQRTTVQIGNKEYNGLFCFDVGEELGFESRIRHSDRCSQDSSEVTN